MAKKKATPDVPDDLKALEAKVDAMMDPRPAAKAQPPTDVAVSPDDLKQQIAANIGLSPEQPTETTVAIQSVATPLATTAPELPGAASKPKPKAKPPKPTKVIEPKADEPKIESESTASETEAVSAQATDSDTEFVTESTVDVEPKVVLEGAELDAAVDDIVVEEADTVLAVEDARRGHKVREAEATIKPKHQVASALWTALLIALLIGIIASLVLVVLYGS